MHHLDLARATRELLLNTARFVVAGLLLWTGCTAEDPGTTAERPARDTKVLALPAPAPAGSGMPQLAPGPDGAVLFSWIEPEDVGHALRFAVLPDGARAWSSPRRVAGGHDWFVNWADVPALSAGSSGRITAHWLRKSGADPYAYDVVVARLGADGAVSDAPFVLHDDARPAEHGFASHAWLGADSTLVVWLDGRAYADGREAMSLRARTVGPGGVGPELLLDDRTCDCCPTAAAVLADGAVLAVYRDRTEAEVRDISAVRIREGKVEDRVTVHADGWVIEGCPVNGPALSATGETAAVAWFTAAGETPRVQAAFTTDGGRTFGTPVRVDAGDPVGRTAVAMLAPDQAAVAWIERDPEGGSAGLMARLVYADGRAGEAVRVANTAAARAAGFPRMARQGDRLVFAWTEVGDPRNVRAGYLPVEALGTGSASADSAGNR